MSGEALLAVAGSPDTALQPVYLVAGDLVLAEPIGSRLAQAIAARLGCSVEAHRRPQRLAPLLADLRTFSLFASGKVILAADTAVLADASGAAELIDQAAEALPAGDGEALSAREREAASRLLQALRLFAVPPDAPDAVERLPDLALQGARGGGGRGRSARKAQELREGLAKLLERARAAGLVGWAEGDLADLASMIESGLPPGNVLVLVESVVADDHPLVRTLRARGAVATTGRVEADRKGFQGLDLLADELERETGATIAPDALRELARRTLRLAPEARGGGALDADSTARLAAEYRKLAAMSGGERIGRALVEEAVEDRGEEDLWGLLDAIAAGDERDAAERLRRFLAGASDPTLARLSFFSAFAGLCRQLVAIAAMAEVSGVPVGEKRFDTFRDRHAPRLQATLPGGGRNPLAGLHPFRLHRAYLAASRLPRPLVLALPWQVLETELALKGESGDAEAALARLVAAVAAGGERPPAVRSSSRRR